jgi:hypothetical protein
MSTPTTTLNRRWPRHFAATILVILPILLTAGCASERPAPYAISYTQALDRYPGNAGVTPEMLESFVQHFAQMNTLTPAATESLYAAELYFSDTLLTTEDRATLVRHVESMRNNDTQVQVAILETLISGADVYLVWTMDATFKPVRKPKTSRTIGVTHLRFNNTGQVVLHQDFWDSAAGVYQHLPVVGAIIRNINGRFIRNAH